MIAMRALGELKALTQEHGVEYSDQDLRRAIEGKGSIKCCLAPNWSLKKDQTCSRSIWCGLRGGDQNLKCALSFVETANRLRKKYWMDELVGFK